MTKCDSCGQFKASGRNEYTRSYRRQTVEAQDFHRLATVATGKLSPAARLSTSSNSLDADSPGGALSIAIALSSEVFFDCNSSFIQINIKRDPLRLLNCGHFMCQAGNTSEICFQQSPQASLAKFDCGTGIALHTFMSMCNSAVQLSPELQ